MAALSSATMSKMRAIRQAQKLGCSGAHQMDDGGWHPCSSHEDYVAAKGRHKSSAVIATAPQRDARGSNKIKKQWENLGQRPISAIDNIQGGGLVAGAPSALIGGGMVSGGGMGGKALGWAPHDNDPDVFTDIEVARNRSRQLGCIGVSRRVSRSGKTVWMPCTNMSDYAQRTGSTSLGRRHIRERAERTITDALKKLQPKPKRERSKSLFSELHPEVYKRLLVSPVDTFDAVQLQIKGLGPRLGRGLRSAPMGMVFVDITGAIDADKDGIVFEGKPLERPIIPKFTIPEGLARRASKLIEGTAEQNEKNRRLGGSGADGVISEQSIQNLISSLATGASGMTSSRRSSRQSRYAFTQSDFTFQPGVLPPVDAGVPFPKKLLRAAKATVRARTMPMRNIEGKYDNYTIEQLQWLVDANIPTGPGQIKRMLEDSPYLLGSPKNIAKRIENAGINYDVNRRMAEILKNEIARSPAVANFVRKYGIPVIVATEFMPNTDYSGRILDVDLGPERWGATMAGWAPLGFIAMNVDTFEGTQYYEFAGHKNTDIAMNLRHELAHAWENMAAKTNDRAKAHYIQQFAELFQGLDELESQGKKNFLTTYHEAAWGTDEEHESALRISSYAETARIEWFAESFAFLTDPNPSNNSRVDSLSRQNMAAVLGMDSWELESLLGTSYFDSLFDDNSGRRGLESRRSFGMDIFASNNEKLSNEFADWFNNNPGYLDDAPLDVFLRTDNEARKEFKRMGMASRITNLAPGEQKAHDVIFGRVDKAALGKTRPTYHHVGGIPGSGKSTLVRDGTIQVPDSSQAFHIDPDEIKTFMSGWNGGRGAQAVHPRSRHLTDMFMAEAAETHGDIVVQGIGKRTEHLRMMRAAGYKTVGHFVYVPSSEADANISQRSQSGGAVLWSGYGSQIADELRSRGTISRQITSDLYDEFYLWDNTGRVPKLAAERREDGTFIIHDEKVWNKFFGDRPQARGTLSSAEWAKGFFEVRRPSESGMSSTKAARTTYTTINSINDSIEKALFLPDVSSREDAKLMTNLITVSNGISLVKDKSITNMDLENAYISFPEFTNVNIEKSDLTNAKLTNGTFINFATQKIDADNIALTHSTFINSSLENSNLRGADFSNTQVVGLLSLSGSDLRNANFSNITFDDSVTQAVIDVSGADLDGAYLGNTELVRFISDDETNWGNARIGYTNGSIPRGLRNRGPSSEKQLDSLQFMNAGELHAIFNDSLIDFNKAKNSTERNIAANNIYAIHDELRGAEAELANLTETRDLAIKRLGDVKKEMNAFSNVGNESSVLNPLKFVEANDAGGWTDAVNAVRKNNPKALSEINPQTILAMASSSYRERQILLSELANIDSEIADARHKKTILDSIESILFADKETVFGERLQIPKKRDRSISKQAIGATQAEERSFGFINSDGVELSPKARKALDSFVDSVSGDVVGMRSTRATDDKKTADTKIADMYEKLSNAILASMDEDIGDKWVRPWNLGALMPRNAKTGKAYRGSNILNLGITQSDSKYKHPVWGTYKMWQELGGQVQKGERGTIIVHWSPVEKETINRDGSVETRSFMRPRLFNVFNIDQVSGVDPDKYKLPELSDEQRVQRMDSILEELNVALTETNNPIDAVLGGGLRAYYNPSSDSIHLPPFSTFNEPIGYYQTAMHELVHWTGHRDRLDRIKEAHFGSEDYAYEELVAEFGSAFLMGILGMEASPQENHAIYIKGWKKRIKDNPDTVRNAINDAQSAVNYILRNSPTLRSEFGMGDGDDDGGDSRLPVAGDIGEIQNAVESLSANASGPISRGRDIAGMRSGRMADFLDVTNYESFGEAGTDLAKVRGRTELEKLRSTLQKEKDALVKTITEWNVTGVWNGSDNHVAIPRTRDAKNGITRNISAEELAQFGDNDSLAKIFDGYVGQIDAQLNHVNGRISDLDAIQSGADISNINTITLMDLPNFKDLVTRGEEIIRSTSTSSSSEKWALTEVDPDNTWLVHVGVPVLKGGVLDPSYTLGKGGDGTWLRQSMDTQRLNKIVTDKLISGYEQAQKRKDAWSLELAEFKKTGAWDGGRLARNIGLPEHKAKGPEFEQHSNNDLSGDNLKKGDALREMAEDAIAFADAEMSRLKYGYENAKEGNTYLSYGIPKLIEWGYSRDDFPTSKAYLVRIPNNEVISGNYPAPEWQIFGTRRPIASFEFESGKNITTDVRAAVVALFEDVALRYVTPDSQKRGMESRTDTYKLSDAFIQDLITNLELNEEETRILRTVLGSADIPYNEYDLNQILSGRNIRTAKTILKGKIEDISPQDSLKESGKDLAKSLSISVSSNGIPIITAKPNPIFESLIPDKRDWSQVEAPDAEKILDFLSRNRGIPKRKWPSNYTNWESSSYGDSPIEKMQISLFDIVEEVFAKYGIDDTGVKKTRFNTNGVDEFIPLYLWSIENPHEILTNLYGTDGVHDAIGHIGTGRGFDRHGEWANALAMISILLDSPDINMTEEEREDTARWWLAEYGTMQLMHQLETYANLDGDKSIDSFKIKHSASQYDVIRGSIENYPGTTRELLAELGDGQPVRRGMNSATSARNSRRIPLVNSRNSIFALASAEEAVQRKRFIDRASNNVDRTRGGLLSRRELVRIHGKSLQEAVDALGLTDAESMAGFEALEDSIGLLDSGLPAKAKVHPELRDKAQELLDSVSVSVSSDGVIMIHAKPNPLIQREFPSQRDWRLVELTKPENVDTAYEKLMTNQLSFREDGEWINYYSTDGRLIGRTRPTDETLNPGSLVEAMTTFETEHIDDSFFTPIETSSSFVKFNLFLQKLLDDISATSPMSPIDAEKIANNNKTNFGGQSWIGGYLSMIMNPQAGTSLGGRDGLHDAFGHFGIGRGFDRHGEWANALAIISLVDHPDFDATPREKEEVKRMWLLEYGTTFITGGGRTKVSHSELDNAISNYGGNISDIISILDDSPRSAEGMSSRSMPIGRASELMIRDISNDTLLRNKRERLIDSARRNPGLLSTTYRGEHTAPDVTNGASFDNLMLNGIYPSNIYQPRQLQFYESGYPRLDAFVRKMITDARGNPDFEVTVYRAVPSDAPDSINVGDWVTPVPQYARTHGESNLGNDFKIIEMKVRAGDIFTEGNSLLEWGYSPVNPGGATGERKTVAGELVRDIGAGSLDTPIRVGELFANTDTADEAIAEIDRIKKDRQNLLSVRDEVDSLALDASRVTGEDDDIFEQQSLKDLPEGHNVLIRNIFPKYGTFNFIPYASATKINGALIIKELTKEQFDELRASRGDLLHQSNDSNSFMEILGLGDDSTRTKSFMRVLKNLSELSNKYNMTNPKLLFLNQENAEDDFWRIKYNNPNFFSAATMSPDGVMTVYKGQIPSASAMRHEWGHHFDHIGTRIDRRQQSPLLRSMFRGTFPAFGEVRLSATPAWLEASERDAETSGVWEREQLGKGWTIEFATNQFVLGKPAVTPYSVGAYEASGQSFLDKSGPLLEDFAESVHLFLFDRIYGYIGKKYNEEGVERGRVRFATLWPERAKILQTLFDQPEEWVRGTIGMESRTRKFDKRFEKKYGDIIPNGDGDCYQEALTLSQALTNKYINEPETKVSVVHGIPLGTGGDAAGLRYGHAWVEVDRTATEMLRLKEQLREAKSDAERAKVEETMELLRRVGDVVVYDYSNGNKYEIPKFLYYAMGNIDESDARKYSSEDAVRKSLDNEHYGPWD